MDTVWGAGVNDKRGVRCVRVASIPSYLAGMMHSTAPGNAVRGIGNAVVDGDNSFGNVVDGGGGMRVGERGICAIEEGDG